MNDNEEMNELHQKILKHLRKNIVEDVDVYNGILNPLRAEYILTENDALDIKAGRTKEERATILLDILLKRGPYAFDIFHQSLKHHYGWLSENIDKLLESHGMAANDMGHYIGITNIPPVSPLTVTREEKMMQLKNGLKKVEPGGYIALHGMKGFGKSCLTASTLKDSKLVKNLFYNKIYWLKFGYERSTDEEILIQLNTLCHLVRNLEILPNSSKSEILKESLVQFLKTHFSTKDNCNSLLILDDVCSKKIIDVFDFNCKTLVITADIDVLYGRSRILIEMNDGFTEAETLGLFAKVLETDVETLPSEAKKIHEECKGMPLLIAMFAAQFEEFKHDMRIHNKRWRYYLDSLRKKDPTNDVMRRFLEIQEAIFDMCIDRLTPELRKLYEHLVIFSEDVNIMPETLEILWEGDACRVEEEMLKLCHKSLAAKQWNAGLGTYIYGVHDLLLCHLRNKLKREDKNKLMELHRSFVEKYRTYCKGDFSKLPEDNYSYSYIGHHLEQAELYHEFPSLYFNFDFIQNKIIHTGLSDLLIDLRKYRKYITKDHDNGYESKVQDLEKFLEEQASILAEHRRKNCLDIVQVAMNHPHAGFVAQTARDLASQRSQYLYLSHDKKLAHANVPLSGEVCTDICTSSFTDDHETILIGNKYGEIILWNCNHIKYRTFYGHNTKSVIKKITVASDDRSFLSLSDNGVVKLFLLNNDDNFDQDIPIRSPKQKQTCWSGLFSNELLQDDSSLTLSIPGEKILDVIFGHDDNYIAACTNRGTIKVWNRRGDVLSHNHNPLNSCFKNIAFTAQSNLLHAMDEGNGILTTYGRCADNYNYISQFNPQLQGKKIIFFHDVPGNDNSLIIVTETKAVYVKWFRSNNDQIHSYEKQVRANVENDQTSYVCAALTHDGQYLVLADTKGFINIWKADEGYQPIATYRSRVNSLDTYWLEEEGYHIICGSENRLLHRWKIPVEEVPKSVRKPLFDAVVRPYGESDTAAKETLRNTIIMFQNDEMIAETEPATGKIINLILSSDGKKMVYSTEKGVVVLFELDHKKTYEIFRLAQPTDMIKFLTIEDNDIIVCREGDENLKVWHNSKITYLVEKSGHVISIHPVNEKRVITVTRDGVITLWEIDKTNWLPLNREAYDSAVTQISYSCLSYHKNYISILTDKTVILYSIEEESTISKKMKIQMCLRFQFLKNLTCCEISQDEQYLAIGYENGDVSIIDIQKQNETRKLSFHKSAITQLYWAPSCIRVPVLLSVDNDELIWWNINLDDKNQKPKRKSRMGINNSVSTPSFSTSYGKLNFPLSTSKSMEGNYDVSSSNAAETSKQQNGHDITNGFGNVSKYWKCKIGRDPKHSPMLAIVQLPPSCTAKVCISSDFSKFVTIDIHGSISTFKLFGYT